MKAKTYKTARAILEHSLAEIEAGHWCQGMLADLGKYKPKWSKKFIRISSEDDPRDVESDDPEFLDKPMGCAIGLVATFGGVGRDITFSLGERKVTFFVPEYPDDDSPQGVKDAVRALAWAVPKRTRKRMGYTDERLEEIGLSDHYDDNYENLVTSYNDRRTVTRKAAAEWFRRALESL